MSDMALKPRLDLGQVISRTFGVIGRNLVPIVLICLLGTLASMALSYLAGIAMEGMDPTGRQYISQVLSTVLNLTAHAILLGSVTSIVVNDLNGRRSGAGTALGVGLRLFLPVIGLNLVVSIGAGVAAILLVVPGIMLLLRWLVAIPARVVEGPGTGRALSRSTELTAGYRWKLFALLLIYAVLVAVITIVSITVSGGFLRMAQLQAAFDPVALTMQVLSAVILTAISTAGVATAYTELRRIKEGAMPDQLASVFA